MKTTPQGSASFRKLNPHLYKPELPRMYVPDGKGGFDREETMKLYADPKPRIRQSAKPLLNKLEQEWFACLRVRVPCHAEDIYAQSIRFKLGNGIWYKPDLWCPTLGTWGCCWEVKGPFAHRGGFENLKVAAHQYPRIKWVLVWKENGQWKEQEVLP